MAAKPAAPAVEEATDAPKKGGNGLMIVLIVLVVILIGAVGGLAFMMMNQQHAAKEGEHASESSHQEEAYKPEDKAKAYSPAYKQFPSPAPGAAPQYFDLEQLVVNFKGEGKAKFLAIKLKMMTNYPEVVTELTNIKPLLINDISAALRKKSYTEMSADDAQEKLAAELLQITRASLESQKVYPDLLDKVLIERFVMQ
ncbi:MAG: flagellar basal body-associated FliL family protein [Proteobacteria bacterium]|nr:flagellar basal body-associated FliL family protein [Pseudomonadota bacterium]